MSAGELAARGTAAFHQQQWTAAFRWLSAADGEAPLGADELDQLATAAFLIGREPASIEARRRAHTTRLASGDLRGATRSAFWLAFTLLDRPDQQSAVNGWLARVRRLLDDCPPDCAEQGLYLCAYGFQHIVRGDVSAARDAFAEAARIGAACRDPDLLALAGHAQGRLLLRQQRIADGLARFDEVMVAVSCGEVGPLVAGVVYCSVIGACHEVFDLRRAREWTGALSDWCGRHPDLVPFRGPCLVRRSELLQLQGDWQESFGEAHRACRRTTAVGAHEAGPAYYQLAELHRLRGAFDEAEEAYRRASQTGRQPYPGLALLRLARGQTAEALSAIRRAVDEVTSPRGRVDTMRALVTIALAAGDPSAARDAAATLDRLATETGAVFLRAAAATAAGAVALDSGDGEAALVSLRLAVSLWQQVEAPYECAVARELIGDAYHRRGDADGSKLEWEAAQEVYERLGAASDSGRLAPRLARPSARPSDGLTGREIEVIRLLAAGLSNRAIAADLSISEKTVARHVSNIFDKLNLSSRAAATAYAYEHRLL